MHAVTNDNNEGATTDNGNDEIGEKDGLTHRIRDIERECEQLRAELAAKRDAVARLEKVLAAKQSMLDLLERNVRRSGDRGASVAALDRRLDSAAKDLDAELIDFGATVAREDRAEPPAEAVELLPPEAFMSGDDYVAPVVHRRGADRKLVAIINGEGVDYPLDKEHITIGRAPSSDIRIASNLISRIHARISTHGIATVIEDAGSKNGILVNRERVKRCVLKDGDVVNLGGELELRFVDARP